MNNNHPDYPVLIPSEAEILGLQKLIADVQTALWGGDYKYAQFILSRIKNRYHVWLQDCLNYKTNLTSWYRREYPQTHTLLKNTTGLRGRSLEFATQAHLSEKSTDRTAHSTQIEKMIYAYLPIAVRIDELDRYATKLLDTKTVIDDSSSESNGIIDEDTAHYRLQVTASGQKEIEIKGFRLLTPNKKEISSKDTIGNLLDELNKFCKTDVIEHGGEGDQWQWPLWLRGFSDTLFFEHKIYNPSRFHLTVTYHGNQEDTISKIVDITLSALGGSTTSHG